VEHAGRPTYVCGWDCANVAMATNWIPIASFQECVTRSSRAIKQPFGAGPIGEDTRTPISGTPSRIEIRSGRLYTLAAATPADVPNAGRHRT